MLGGALWNALFEMLVVRGVKAFLVGAELAASGRGPVRAIREVMDPVIHHAAWVASLWTAVVWLAAAATIHYASADPRLEPSAGAASGAAE
ncbi:MAG: hypothetical protein ABI603_01070 [Acidobacteriota bacterium]